jgi:DNA polymerase III sliding clamp (beta) subunit (PCNA family)
MSGLNAIVDVISLRNAITAMGRVAPNRHFPHVRLDVQEDTATLSVAVPSARLCVPVPFVRASVPGSVMLPMDRVPSLLRLTKGITADVELLDGPFVRIRTREPKSGLSAVYNLATVAISEDSESTGPIFAPDASLWALPCNDLQRALERVRHAIGDSSRYSLDGALIELDGSRVALVATDTRRLARQEFRAQLVGPGSLPFGPESRGETYRPILPESVFKALSGLLKSHGGPDVGLSFAEAPAVNPKIDHEPTRWARFTFGGEGAELIVRLADGKFPKWEQVRPDEHALDSSATLNPTDLMRAVTCAKVGTTDDAPGIRLESIGLGDASALRLSAGETMAESYADVHRGAFGITLDARLVLDALKALGKTSQPLVIRATAAQTETGEAIPAILETADGFLGLICPITAEPKSVPEPKPTAEEIGAAEMAAAWPLSLEPGDVAVRSGIRAGEGSTGRWHVVGPHPDGPGLYVARPETPWGALGEETCIDPRGPQWSLQVSADDDDESDPEPIASDPARLPIKLTAKRILTLPYGTAETNDAADRWTERYYRWWDRRPEGSDVHGSLGHRVWANLTLGDHFAMARRRHYARQDEAASRASVDPWHVEIPAPEPLSVAPSDPATQVGNPLLQAIIDTQIPRPRRADLRREPRKVWAKSVRSLFRDLGLSGISVRAPRYSQASSIDITIPGQVAHETSPMRGHDFATCPLCRQEHAAERHIERLVVGAFPDLDDRSEYGTDYFDNPLSIHTGSPIPVASDPEPLPVASTGIGYPAPAMIYPLQPIILLDDPEPLSDPEPETGPKPIAPESRKARALRRSAATPQDHPIWPLGPDEGIPGIPPEILSDVLWALGVYRERRADIARWAAMDADGRYVAEYVASPEPRRRVQSAARTLRKFCLMAGMNDLDPFATLRYLANGATPSSPVPKPRGPEPIAPEPEPLPVANVRGIPITYGRSVPRVAPQPMARTRNGITLREPEPIGAPENVTVADAGAPAIGQAALVIECHGHTEPLSQESTSSIPSDPPSDPEPITVSRVAPEPLSDPEPSRYTRRVAHGLTLAESIDHEADRLEARCNGAGRLMARALRELAESVRWSGATTPDEHEARMELWNEWAVDNEPRESMTGY